MSSDDVRSILTRLTALEVKVLAMEKNQMTPGDVRREIDDALDAKLGKAVWKIAGVVAGGLLLAYLKGQVGL